MLRICTTCKLFHRGKMFSSSSLNRKALHSFSRIPRPIFALRSSSCNCLRSFSKASGLQQSSSTLELSYDLHQPSKPISNPKDAPIIFMHGLFGSKRNNRSMSKALARDLGRTVYALDLRNHGASPHDSRHDYVAMAEDVAGFIEQHGLQYPSLIGHSMGSKVAMTLALRSPEMIHDIVSVDNAPWDVALLGEFDKYIRGMKIVQDLGVTKQADADNILKDYEDSLPIRQFLLSNLVKTESGLKFNIPLNILGSALSNLGDFPYKDPEERRFEKPALFVRGTRSRYVPDEALPVIGRFFPLFRLVDIESGHWVISEAPELFRRAIVEFLKPQD